MKMISGNVGGNMLISVSSVNVKHDIFSLVHVMKRVL